MDGYSSPESVVFSYTEPPTVSGLLPDKGFSAGGEQVTVVGSNFSFSSNLECMFGTVAVPAMYVSSSQVMCSAPQHVAGSVNVTVRSDGIMGLLGTDKIIFRFIETPTIDSIIPSAGPLSGGTMVKVLGSNFDASSVTARCLFGSISSPAVVLSSGELRCTAPSSGVEGVVDFSVAMTSSDQLSGLVTYRYFNSFLVTGCSPSHGSTRGDTFDGLWFVFC